MAILGEPEHRMLIARAAYTGEEHRLDFAEVRALAEEVYGAWSEVLRHAGT